MAFTADGGAAGASTPMTALLLAHSCAEHPVAHKPIAPATAMVRARRRSLRQPDTPIPTPRQPTYRACR